MVRIISLSLCCLFVAATCSAAGTSSFELTTLAGDYVAAPGQNVRSHVLVLPDWLGSVDGVSIECLGDFEPGETRDSHGTSFAWPAELNFFLLAGGEVFWLALVPEDGSFQLSGDFTRPGAQPSTIWPLHAGVTVTVDAVLLANGDEGRIAVRHPDAVLGSVSLVLAAMVGNEDATWSDVKALYR